jgi:hypothetical protein
MLATKRIARRDRATAAVVDLARAERGTSFNHISYTLFVLLTAYLNRKSDAMEDNAGIDLPLNLGEFIILQMGHVIPHPPFMDSDHVWPVGYKR